MKKSIKKLINFFVDKKSRIDNYVKKDKEAIDAGKVNICLYIIMSCVCFFIGTVYVIIFKTGIIKDNVVFNVWFLRYYSYILCGLFIYIGILCLVWYLKCIPYCIRLLCIYVVAIILFPLYILFLIMCRILKILFDEEVVFEVFFTDWTIIYFAFLLFLLEYIFCIKMYPDFFVITGAFLVVRLFLLVGFWLFYKIFKENFDLDLSCKKIVVLTVIESIVYYVVFLIYYDKFSICLEFNYIKDYITLFTLIVLFYEKRKCRDVQ